MATKGVVSKAPLSGAKKMDNTPGSYADVDRYISHLMECKPLSEQDVKNLCDKVKYSH